MIRPMICLCVALILAGCSDQGKHVADPGIDGAISFTDDVLPVLGAHCISCHSAGGGGYAGLDLTSHAGVMAGSENGAVVVADEPDSSVLVQRIESNDPSFLMPSGGPRMTEDRITLIKNWIAEGARDN